MKILTAIVQFCQLIALGYVGINVMVGGDIDMLIVLFIVLVNVWMIGKLVIMMRGIADANIEFYKGFAKRLEWEDIVGDLDELKRGGK